MSGVKPVPATRAHILEAARLVRAGELVVFPTDTVYGVGSDATNDQAMEALVRLKGRPPGKPLIVLIAAAEEAARYAVFDERAEHIARTLWPGPVTLVLRRREACALSPLVSAETGSVALRLPANLTALKLIEAAERPLAAPSANPPGEPTPRTAAGVARVLGEAVAMILDGGPAPSALPSTVVDLTAPKAVIVRHGAVPAERITALVGPLASRPTPE